MKKSLIIISSLLMPLMVASIASANQYLPETNRIKSEVETVLIRSGSSKNGPQYAVIDHNPTSYNKQLVGGHTIEGWIKNGVVNTAINGEITKTYQINSALETVLIRAGSSKNGPQYDVIDHNPTSYTKRVTGGHTIESWMKDEVAYTAVNGELTKVHPIKPNKPDTETGMNRPSRSKK